MQEIVDLICFPNLRKLLPRQESLRQIRHSSGISFNFKLTLSRVNVG